MKSDDQIIMEGGDANEIKAYAEEHGADLTEKDFTSKSKTKELTVGDKVFCNKSLPYGRSGRRVVLGIAEGHSIYVRLTKKDSAYQNREPHQGFWQVPWGDFKTE